MAYIGQEKKAALAPAIKAICARYKVKASLAVRQFTGPRKPHLTPKAAELHW